MPLGHHQRNGHRAKKLARIVETNDGQYGDFALFTVDQDGFNHRLIQQHSYSHRGERDYARRMIVTFAENAGYLFANPGP